jgi:arylsulfatase A-like enzyme
MAERPNIVMFMPDQLRADAVGAFGNPRAHTPNIDALAARGTIFTNAFAQHSVCGPSRVAIFTGWYPHVSGHRTLTNLIKPWEPNLLRMLKDAGYNVAFAGHRGDTFAPGVTEASTDFAGFSVQPKMLWMPSPYPPGHKLADAFYHGRRAAGGVALDFDEATVQTAEQWLADGPREPWVLFVALVFPHCPFEVEEPWFSMHDRAGMPAPVPALLDDKPRYMRAIRERYGTARLDERDWAEIIATYYGMVSRVDDQLGRVMRAVDRAGASPRTLTAFFTDHGEYAGDFGLVEKWPSGLSDCLLRNPLVIAGPGVREGNRADAMVEMIDLMPTLAEIGNADTAHTHFGRSLTALLRAQSQSHREAAFSEGGFTIAEEPLLERARWPYDRNSALQHEDPTLVGRAIAARTERWTYIYRLYERAELYDRAADPRETVNLEGRAELAEVERAMRQRILAWSVETSDVIPWKADPRVPHLERRTD